MSDDNPPEKPTIELEKPPAWAIELAKAQKEGIATVRNELVVLTDKVESCVHGLGTLNGVAEQHSTELRELREWKGGVDERFNSHSMRAKAESLSDANRDARMDQFEIIVNKANTGQTALLVQAFKDMSKTPQGQKLINGLVIFLLAAMTYGTFWLSTHGGAK